MRLYGLYINILLFVIIATLAITPSFAADKAVKKETANAESQTKDQAKDRTAPKLLIPQLSKKTKDDTPLYKAEKLLNDEELSSKLALALARDEMEGIVLGLHVVDAITGEEYIGINSMKPLVPASNVKILSTAAALKHLGSDYKFETGFFSLTEIDKNGLLDGDLIVVGGGNPMLPQSEMSKMVLGLYALGLRKINGNIIIDDTFFDDQRPGPGWEEDDTDNSYQAPMGAFSFNYNSLTIFVQPGASNKPPLVSILPKSSYYTLENTATTTDYKNTELLVHTPKAGNRNKVTIKGNINRKAKRRVFKLKIDNPPLFAGISLKDTLEREGIEVSGSVELGDNSEETKLIWTHKSKRLSEVVNKINGYSNNHAAEQVMKTLGAELYEPPGTWDKGLKAVKEFIRDELGFDDNEYTLANASGLASVNFIPPAIFTKLLQKMIRDPYVGPEFVTSLAVAGQSGTMDESFTELIDYDMLRAKTGSMEQVIALSGYLSTRSGRTLAISFIMNECRGHNRLKLLRIQEEIVYLLTSYSPDADVLKKNKINKEN